MSNFLERLDGAVRILGGPLKLSRMLEVSKGTIYNWLEKGNVPADKLIQMAVLGADVGYILSGIKTNETEQALVIIPRYSVRASTGFGNSVFDEGVTHSFAFRRDWLQKKGLKEDDLSIIAIQGDSMTPVLQEGDLVLLDASDTEIKSGKAYVVQVDSELVVKYVQRLPGDKIQLSSENQKYPPFTVDGISNVDIVGRVVCSSHEW